MPLYKDMTIEERREYNRRWQYPERRAYADARYRCTNPKSTNWKHYGGRGIQFLFTSFEQFLAEVGKRPTPKHSLDRKDNNGHYEPGNVKWATKKEQMLNRRKISSRLQTVADEELIAEVKRRGLKVL